MSGHLINIDHTYTTSFCMFSELINMNGIYQHRPSPTPPPPFGTKDLSSTFYRFLFCCFLAASDYFRPLQVSSAFSHGRVEPAVYLIISGENICLVSRYKLLRHQTYQLLRSHFDFLHLHPT